jgi:hypothetical protein
MMQVDFDIGRWMVSDGEGTQAIAIVKDIEAFCIAAGNAMFNTDLEQAQAEVMSMIDFVEFGKVELQKNGVVKWQGGEFAEDDGDTKALLMDEVEQYRSRHCQ